MVNIYKRQESTKEKALVSFIKNVEGIDIKSKIITSSTDVVNIVEVTVNHFTISSVDKKFRQSYRVFSDELEVQEQVKAFFVRLCKYVFPDIEADFYYSSVLRDIGISLDDLRTCLYEWYPSTLENLVDKLLSSILGFKNTSYLFNKKDFEGYSKKLREDFENGKSSRFKDLDNLELNLNTINFSKEDNTLILYKSYLIATYGSLLNWLIVFFSNDDEFFSNEASIRGTDFVATLLIRNNLVDMGLYYDKYIAKDKDYRYKVFSCKKASGDYYKYKYEGLLYHIYRVYD